jgi:hypothetical protein
VIDEVSYFDMELSATHIYEIYLADPPPPEESAVPAAAPVRAPAPAVAPAPAPAPAVDEPTQDPAVDTEDEGEPSEPVEETTDGEGMPGPEGLGEPEELMSPSGTWRREDGSLLEITLKKKESWVGKVARAGARKAKAKKARAAKACGLEKGDKVLTLKRRKKGGFKGKIVETRLKKNGKCKSRKLPLIADFGDEQGDTLVLTKGRGKKRSEETLELA